jgi:hypothetical protein
MLWRKGPTIINLRTGMSGEHRNPGNGKFKVSFPGTITIATNVSNINKWFTIVDHCYGARRL